MNLDQPSRLGFFALILLCCGVRSALAEPERAPPTPFGAPAAQRTDDRVADPKLDSELLARLSELQASRRAARQAALADAKHWEDARPERASAHRAQLAALWGSLVGSIDGQARLRMHAERMARLNRMLDLAEHQQGSALAKRIQADIERELMRHAQSMRALQATVGMQ
jgi:hypothetical protein